MGEHADDAFDNILDDMQYADRCACGGERDVDGDGGEVPVYEGSGAMNELEEWNHVSDVHDKVQLSKQIRESARQLFDLACDMATESTDPSRFWTEFDKLRPTVAENIHETRPKEKGKMTDLEARRFGSRPIPFGEFAGRRVDDVPLDRLEWYACQDFVDELRRYLKSNRIQMEGGQTQEEPYCDCLHHEEYDGRGVCRVCGRKKVSH